MISKIRSKNTSTNTTPNATQQNQNDPRHDPFPHTDADSKPEQITMAKRHSDDKAQEATRKKQKKDAAQEKKDTVQEKKEPEKQVEELFWQYYGKHYNFIFEGVVKK